MRKKKIILIASILILSVMVLIIKKHYSTKSSPEAPSVWVKAEPVKEQSLAIEALAIGTLVAAKSVVITPEIVGHVEKIFFQDGSFVKQGTPLIQLDDASARAQWISAKANLAYSEADYKRKAWLEKKGAIARQAIEQAEADLKEKKAIAEEKQIALDKNLLRAPFDGVMGKCGVNVGDYVTVGQNIVRITDTHHLRVEYSVSEKYLPELKQGQAISLTASAYPGKTFVGTLAFISPTINSEERTIALYAEVPNEHSQLKPGMFVNVVQSLGNQDHVLVVPARTLVPVMGGEQIYKIVNGKAQAVSVVIGNRSHDRVQIAEGLLAGDMVITDGQLKLKDGIPVQVSVR